MKVVPLDNSKLTLSEVVKLARAGPLILTRKGKPLVAIRDLAGSSWEAVSSDPKFVAIVEEARRAYREEGGTGLDEVRRELGLRTTIKPRRKKP
jgi:hypothetical protein